MSELDPLDFEAEQDRNAAAEADAERELRYEVSDLAWLMGSKRGRRVMHRLLSQSGVHRLSYTPGDALATAFNEGQRNIGNRLTAILMAHCGSDYALMVQERSNARS
jgi:hypothetical protein